MAIEELDNLVRWDFKTLRVNVDPNGIYIYALCDPDSNEIRYVGKSQRIIKRIGQHLSKGRQAGFKRHSACWLSGLIAAGKAPNIVILENIPTHSADSWEERERWWIAALKESGCRLTNITTGGEGGASYGRLGKKNSPEHLAKTRAGRLGIPVVRKDLDGWQKRRNEGVRRYYARTREQGIILKRGPISEEHRRKISEANKRPRLPVLQYTPNGDFVAEHATVTHASKSIGIAISAISGCLNGHTKTSGGFLWKFKTNS